jgi:TubC N-terminal docking domain
MTITELLTRIQEAGIILVLEDGQLRYRPMDRMTPELAAAIRAHREMIIAALAGKAPAQERENVKTPEPTPCEHPLHLPESQALGRCIRCQSEAEFVDTLARIKIHHERTKRAVAARVKELEGSHGRS